MPYSNNSTGRLEGPHPNAAWLTALKSFPTSSRQRNAKAVHRNQIEGKKDVLSGRACDPEHGSSSSSSSSSEPEQDAVDEYGYEDDLEEHGHDVLAIALDRAVVKFEDHQITMLVKTE